MRENRTYGSEGGEAGKPAFPTPIIGINVDAASCRVSSAGQVQEAHAETWLRRPVGAACAGLSSANWQAKAGLLTRGFGKNHCAFKGSVS